MTVNRASAIGVKRELSSSRMSTVKSCPFNVLVPPSFDKRKKAETNRLHCKASIAIGLPMHTQPAGRQNRNIISIILTFSPVTYSFYDKILLLESSSLC